MSQNRSVVLALFVSLMLGASSCSIKENAAKATENSGRAADNSARAADAAAASREEIANGRIAQRTSNASNSRRDAFNSMLEMKSFEMKLTEASKYVKAFEYQYWSGQRYDTPEYLDRLYHDAMKEFFRSVTEAYGDKSIVGEKISALSLDEIQKDKNLNILALAVSMHGLSNMQELVTIPKIKQEDIAVSMYELMKRALRKAEKVDKGELDYSELKEYESTVFYYRDTVIALMNARINMFLTMTLTKVSNIKKGKLEAIKLYTASSFDSNFTTLNLGEQKQVNKFVETAGKVVTFMQELGLGPEYDSTVHNLFLKMRYPNSDGAELKTLSIQGQTYHKEFLDQLEVMFKVGSEKLSAR